VFTLFDYESQDRGVNGKDPLKSKFRARSDLLLVRTPKSGYVVDTQFSGNILDAGAPRDLTIDARSWPESEQFCDIPWDELDQRLSA
jgi:hypothetical protein